MRRSMSTILCHSWSFGFSVVVRRLRASHWHDTNHVTLGTLSMNISSCSNSTHLTLVEISEIIVACTSCGDVVEICASHHMFQNFCEVWELPRSQHSLRRVPLSQLRVSAFSYRCQDMSRWFVTSSLPSVKKVYFRNYLHDERWMRNPFFYR